MTPKFIRLEFDGSMGLRCQTCIGLEGNRHCIDGSNLWLQTPGHANTIADLSEFILNDFGLLLPIHLFSGEYLLQYSAISKVLDLCGEALRVFPKRNCPVLLRHPSGELQEEPMFFPNLSSTPIHRNDSRVDNYSLLIGSNDDRGSTNLQGQGHKIRAEDELFLDLNRGDLDPAIITNTSEDSDKVDESAIDTETEGKAEITAIENSQDTSIASFTEQTLIVHNSPGPASACIAGQSPDKNKMNVSSYRKIKRERESFPESTLPKKQIRMDNSASVPKEKRSLTTVKIEISHRNKRKISELLSTSVSSEGVAPPMKQLKTENGKEQSLLDPPTTESGVLNSLGPLSGIERYQFDHLDLKVPGEEGRWLPVPSLDPLDLPIRSRIRFEYKVCGNGREIVSVPLVGILTTVGDTFLVVKVLSEDGKSTGTNKRTTLMFYDKNCITNVEIWSAAQAAGLSPKNT